MKGLEVSEPADRSLKIDDDVWKNPNVVGVRTSLKRTNGGKTPFAGGKTH